MSNEITLRAIANVSNSRNHLDDDNWGEVVSHITLVKELDAKLLEGLDTFSHVEVVFCFDQLSKHVEIPPTRHPRNNQAWPKIGLLAQRSVHHPNPIGLTVVRVLGVEGNTLIVRGLDAVNGSPVLDLKPVFKEFLPDSVEQPRWVSELMKDYWSRT